MFSQSVVFVVNPGIGLGFGPQSIVPVSAGVPVYTAGDTIWAESYFNSSTVTMILNSPKGTVTSAIYVEPDSIAKIYTISPLDPTGVWSLSVYSSPSSPSSSQVSIDVLNGTVLPPPSYVGAGLSKGDIDLAYQMASTPAYSIQACLLGARASSTASIPLPSSLGGTMQVSLNGTTVSSYAPSSKTPFASWFELYTEMTYVNGSNLVSDQVLAGQTQVLTEGVSAGPASAQLSTTMYLRTGRFDLRTYVREESGLLTFDTPYLRVNSSAWIALSGCASLSSVTSGAFALSSPLNGTSDHWPRYLLTMYDVGGIDSFTTTAIPAEEARVDLGNSTQSKALAGDRVQVSGAEVSDWSAYNGSVYVIGLSFPLQMNVTVSFGDVTSETFGAAFTTPFSVVTLQIPTGTVELRTLVSGASLANATVLVNPVGSPGGSVKTNSTGAVILALPPGAYDFGLNGTGVEAGQSAQVVAGQAVQVALDSSPQGFPLLAAALALLLAAAVGVNFMVWRAYARRRSSFERSVSLNRQGEREGSDGRLG